MDNELKNKKAFTDDEVRAFRLKTHIKNHLFEYVLNILVKMAFAAFIVFISKGTEYWVAILIGFILGISEVLGELKAYRKDYIEIDIAKRNK